MYEPNAFILQAPIMTQAMLTQRALGEVGRAGQDTSETSDTGCVGRPGRRPRASTRKKMAAEAAAEIPAASTTAAAESTSLEALFGALGFPATDVPAVTAVAAAAVANAPHVNAEVILSKIFDSVLVPLLLSPTELPTFVRIQVLKEIFVQNVFSKLGNSTSVDDIVRATIAHFETLGVPTGGSLSRTSI